MVAVPILAGSVTTPCWFPATGARPPRAHAVRRSADAASAPASLNCLDIEILRFLVACSSDTRLPMVASESACGRGRTAPSDAERPRLCESGRRLDQNRTAVAEGSLGTY